jgi:hypothetical protein
LRPRLFENFGAGAILSPYHLCYEEIQQADIFVGVYAFRYGWIPDKDHYGPDTCDGSISFVQMEYRWALERKIPMLIYFMDEVDRDGNRLDLPPEGLEKDPERRAKLDAFKQEMLRAQFVTRFHSLGHLRKWVSAGLSKVVHQKILGERRLDEIVFISHSSKDDAFVDQLTARLQAAGLQPWVDHLHILPGADWDTALESALHAANSLIVVLTPDSNKSLIVKAEWSYFGESGKKIYPILLKETEVPFRLRVLQVTDFRSDPRAAFNRLLETYGIPANTIRWEGAEVGE